MYVGSNIFKRDKLKLRDFFPLKEQRDESTVFITCCPDTKKKMNLFKPPSGYM